MFDSEYLTVVLSCVYAVFIVTLGVVIYISDLITGESVMAEIFSIYLMTLGLLWLIYIYIDIKRQLYRREIATVSAAYTYVKEDALSRETIYSRHNNERELQLTLHMPCTTIPETLRDVNCSLYGSNQTIINTSNETHGYCFSRGRHSGSFYLKVGAAGFCFGHLIHSGLLLGHQVVFFTSDSKELADCANIAALILDVIYPTYSFFQLFFIFKYSNVIINRCQELARFALMHCISSSICFWIWTILRETMDSLHHSTDLVKHENPNKSSNDKIYDDEAPYEPSSTSTFWDESDEVAVSTTSPEMENLKTLQSLPLTSYREGGARDLLMFLNGSSYISKYCQGSSHLSTIFDNISPYLYPFTIEYSILVVGVLFIIWQNIGRCKKFNASTNTSGAQVGSINSRIDMGTRTCSTNSIGDWFQPVGGTASADVGVSCSRRAGNINHCKREECNWGHFGSHGQESVFSSNLVIHADCHSANKGLFAGLIILVGSVVSIILFFIAMADKNYIEMGLVVNSVTELTLLVVMTLASGIAYHQLSRLDVNHHPVSLLDDLLLFLCIPAFFLYAIFSIVPAVEKTSYLSITNTVLQVIQVLIQTPFIIDGLRRCSDSQLLQRLKPGRELVTFLIVCNVAMWFIETFEIKSQAVHDDRNEFYGKVLWTMLSHMTLPLTMFYRFHSSVCLVDIWKSAYEPGG